MCVYVCVYLLFIILSIEHVDLVTQISGGDWLYIWIFFFRFCYRCLATSSSLRTIFLKNNHEYFLCVNILFCNLVVRWWWWWCALSLNKCQTMYQSYSHRNDILSFSYPYRYCNEIIFVFLLVHRSVFISWKLWKLWKLCCCLEKKKKPSTLKIFFCIDKVNNNI